MASFSERSTEQLTGTPGVQNSVFMQAWNLMNTTTRRKSTVALSGSDANMHDVLSELEKMQEEDLKGNDGTGRQKSVSKTDFLATKKCFSGINCVLGDDESNGQRLGAIPSYHRNVIYDYAELVGEKPDKYSEIGLDADFPPQVRKPHYDHSANELQNFRENIARSRRSDYRFQTQATNSRLNSGSKSPLPPFEQTRELENQSLAEHTLAPPVHLSPTTGDNCFLPEDIQNQNTLVNRNNININLTFAMGQYQNSGKSYPSADYDVEEIKAPRRRATQRKERAETSVQTDSDDIVSASHSRSVSSASTNAPQLDFDLDSTSAFPSVTPSHHNYQNRRYDPETTICVPETKELAWNEYIDIPAVVAYTGESMKSIIDTADHIINNFIIMPDDNLYTEEELIEGEGKLGIAIMRLLGVPQQLRHSIYNEALHDLQAIQDISVETVSVINNVIDWLCDGDGDGKEKIINRVRRLASVTTDFQPDSEAWVQFESEFGVYTQTVGEVMKQSYEVGADVARRFSETILNTISSKTEYVAILPTHSVVATANPPSTPASRRASSIRMQPSLSSILEESESGNETIETVELKAEREKFEKLKEAFKQIQLVVEADVQEKSESCSTLNETPTWLSKNLELELDSNKIHHGSSPFEWQRDAFMEAPIPEPENAITKAFNSLCDTLTSTFLDKTKNAILSIQGSGMTPILGESQCSSRDERVVVNQAYGNVEVKEEGNGNPQSSEIQLLAEEIQKLAVLTDSYFLDPKDDLNEVPEPEDDCPPPPVPKRQPSSIASETVIHPIDIDQEIVLAEDYTESVQVPIFEDLTDPWDSSVPMLPVPDANDNTMWQEESPLPQISDLMHKLKKFWPNNALCMILTPEAQLQFAMNSFFEANGSKTEVQMSVAALKVLDKPKAVETPGLGKIDSWTVLQLDGTQVKNEKDLDNEMDDLERMILDLSTEVQKKQSAKAVTDEPFPEATEIQEKQEGVTVNESECDVTWTVEVTPAIQQTAMDPESTIPPEIQIEDKAPKPEEPQSFEEDVQRATTTSIQINDPPTTTVPPKKPSVSSCSRTPSRFATPTRPIVRAQSNGTGTTGPRVPKKPFVFGKASIPASPRQVQRIKVIDTIPFPQPKTGTPRGVLPQIQPTRRPIVTGSGYGQRGPTIPSRENSRTNLSRSNSYRQLFQIKQQVASGQQYVPTSIAQSPNTNMTNSASKESSGPSTFVAVTGSQELEVIESAPQDSLQRPNVASTPEGSIRDSTSSTSATSRRKSRFWPF